jgi:hypothetical protein
MLPKGLSSSHSINEATHWGETAQDEYRIGTEVLEAGKEYECSLSSRTSSGQQLIEFRQGRKTASAI